MRLVRNACLSRESLEGQYEYSTCVFVELSDNLLATAFGNANEKIAMLGRKCMCLG